MAFVRRHYANLLIVIGVFVLLYPIITEVYGAYIQASLNTRWERQAREQARRATLAERRQLRTLGRRLFQNEDAVLSEAQASLKTAEAKLASQSFPQTRIVIPKLGVEQVVLEGVADEVIKNGPGHYPGTANPGQKGNAGIAGHRVTYTRPFNRVDELVAGDVIVLETLDYTYEYKVLFNKQLDPSDLSMLQPTRDARLTLTTCAPKFSARYRLDVQAKLAKATPRRRPTLLRRLVKRVSQPDDVPRNIFEVAIRKAKDELAQTPSSAAAHTKLGAVYQSFGRYVDAQNEYNAAIHLDPRLALPRYQMGLLYQRLNRRDDAIDELETALALDKDFEPAYFRLGLIYLDTREYGLAIKHLEGAAELAPLSGDTHFYLGVAYEKDGDPVEAAHHYNEALRFVPDYREARAALKRLTP